jgi:hypothetical protein
MAVIMDIFSDWRNWGEKGWIVSRGRIMNPKGITRAERARAGKRLRYSKKPWIRRQEKENRARG